MFHYVEDKEFLRRVRGVCGELMQDFCHTLKDAYDIGANFCLVGSGARNLTVQNASEPIDLDYNLEIVRCVNLEDCRAIKACAKNAFDKALAMHGWGNCEDSTSAPVILPYSDAKFDGSTENRYSVSVTHALTGTIWNKTVPSPRSASSTADV